MKLKSENPKNATKALNAFKMLYAAGRNTYRAVFEHGQLWITSTGGAQWAVMDAEGPGSVNGFDFEQVSHDEDED